MTYFMHGMELIFQFRQLENEIYDAANRITSCSSTTKISDSHSVERLAFHTPYGCCDEILCSELASWRTTS